MYKYLRFLPLTYFILVSLLVMCLSGCKQSGDPYKDMTAQQIYSKGKEAALKGNYSQAAKDFDALEAHYPYGEYTDKGQLALIDAYSRSDEPASALAAAERFIRIHPRHPNVDFAYYMKGVINYRENFSFVFRNLPLDRSMRASSFAQQGFDDFKTLVEKFPYSRYAYDAHKRMILLREQLANHELNIAKYYVRQGAHLAAANRAGYVLNQFPQTRAVPKALLIMHQSYAKIGMKKEAQEAMEMLELNFPEYHKDN